ncbi:hypothetical protein EDB19DRAFT_1839676 [Suillus lakei]|nr:hypothetical protein EDB19DRAFT_1839676 [Suillus lakei]
MPALESCSWRHCIMGALLEVLEGHGLRSMNSIAWNSWNKQLMFALCLDDNIMMIHLRRTLAALHQVMAWRTATGEEDTGKAEATDLLDNTSDFVDKVQNDSEASKRKLDIDVWKSLSDFVEEHTQTVTPQRYFGHDILNMQRGASEPAQEAPRKRRKLARAFEFEAPSLSVAEALLKVAGGIEAAIDRQTELLSLILNAMESQGGSTSIN